MARRAKQSSKTSRSKVQSAPETSGPAESADGNARPTAWQPKPEAWQPEALVPRFKSQPLECGLYVVATPIGNLMDITLRALDVLSQADLVACEDTRVTGKLLSHFGLSAPLLAYNDHSGAKVRPKILAALDKGQRVALVSDAGTPLISDPGYKLVKTCLDAGHKVIPVPGASALLAAAVAAGLPTNRLVFCGFLPPKAKARQQALAKLAAIDASVVVYENGPRLAATLSDMAGLMDGRSAVVARELTKLHEEVRRGPLRDLAEVMAAESPPKGEVVVMIGPPAPDTAVNAADLDQALTAAMASMSVRDAAATVAAATGVAKKDVYSRALALAAKTDGG